VSHKTDAKQLKNDLTEEGFTVRLTGSGHWEVRDDHGERVTTFPQTPSDRRWRQNALGAIRRWKRSRGIPVGAGRLETVMIPVTVVVGDTLSSIASDHGTTWQVLAEDNPSITNPNLIYAGETVLVPSGGSFSSWSSSPDSSPSGQTSGASSDSTGGGTAGSVSTSAAVPGWASCIVQKESGGNPSAVNSVPGYIGNGGGLFGDLTSTWNGYDGYAQPFDAPVSVQVQFNDQLEAQDGLSPWAADGCPGT
jgi:LysM repeat protein